MDVPSPDPAERAWLADWRRRVAALYAEVRARWPADPAGAWEVWRSERERLYRGHPQSPVPAAERDAFRAHHWPYDDRLGFVVRVDDDPPAPGIMGGTTVTPTTPAPGIPGGRAIVPITPAPLALPNSGGEDLAFDRVGRVTLPLPGGIAAGRTASLSLFWMRGYAGGLFLAFRDATNGAETYGAGRYVLDTAKGADLGGDPAAGTLVVDLNFAYHPSCAFDARWACPLAPPENRLPVRVEAGERLR